MRIISGDILKSDVDIICHQVNCVGVMGAGLAKQIREKYPEVYQEYTKYCNQAIKPQYILGDVLLSKCKDGKVVANLFGQVHYGAWERQTDYKALGEAFTKTATAVSKLDKTVGLPYKIGCGLAGGNWDIVQDMIVRIFKDCDYRIYKL